MHACVPVEHKFAMKELLQAVKERAEAIYKLYLNFRKSEEVDMWLFENTTGASTTTAVTDRTQYRLQM